MRKEFIELTPDKAKEFIAHNYANNRNVLPGWVNQLAEDIKEGRWNYDISEVDQGISFTPEGELINGQHRCLAVIKANKSINVWVNYDVPVDLYQYMDGGRARKPSDFLTVANANKIATIARVLYAIENGHTTLHLSTQGKLIATKDKTQHQVTSVTRQQIINEVAERNDYLQRIHSLSARASAYLSRKTTQMAYALLTIDFVGRGFLLDDFVDECSRLNTDSNVINACRSYMMQRLATKTFNGSCDWYMGCIFCCYDHFVESSDIGSFNKASLYFQKYDALMRNQREANKKGE